MDKVINRLWEKYYAPRKTLSNEKGQVIAAMRHHNKGLSRNDLMLQAKTRLIKNFRVMNKEELQIVLNEPHRIEEIQQQAVMRWREGWGKERKNGKNS